jgi:DNA-binding NarL/FixJ family response regulator
MDSVRTHRPDIFVLDISMPGRNAFDVLRELTEKSPNSRVIVFTGLGERSSVTNAVIAGAWGFVFKHEGPGVLLKILRIVAEGGFALSDEARRATN